MSPRLISTPEHVISISVGGRQVVGWEAYDITVGILDPCGHFSMRIPFDRAVWNLVKPDAPIEILIDDTTILTGFIDERFVPDDGNDVIEINGRDRAGRLVDEDAPGVNFDGMSTKDLITLVIDPWFKNLTFNNAFNRRVMRGRGQKAKAGREPVILFAQKKIGTHIEPGQRRGQVIKNICEQAGCLAWAQCDGKAYVVGLPNYEQEENFRFFMPKSGSVRTAESTVAGMGIHESVAERYSRIIVVGTGTGTDANYGPSVTSRYGEAKNNEATPQGDGLDFTQPKRLIVRRSAKSTEEADELADREMAKRDSAGHWISVRAHGHGQLWSGAYTTLFAPDTMASVEDERTGVSGKYLITQCTYRTSREGAEETSLHLVPKGSVLA